MKFRWLISSPAIFLSGFLSYFRIQCLHYQRFRKFKPKTFEKSISDCEGMSPIKSCSISPNSTKEKKSKKELRKSASNRIWNSHHSSRRRHTYCALIWTKIKWWLSAFAVKIFCWVLFNVVLIIIKFCEWFDSTRFKQCEFDLLNFVQHLLTEAYLLFDRNSSDWVFFKNIFIPIATPTKHFTFPHYLRFVCIDGWHKANNQCEDDSF